MKLVLLIIDMQKCFLDDFVDRRALEECCEYINHVGRLLRRAGHTVIHVQDVEDADSFSAEAMDFIDEIEIEDADAKVTKIESNAFWDTELDNIVKDRGCDLVIVCGQAAEHCVIFTYNGARERGHNAVILQNGVLSGSPDRVRHLTEDRNLISYPVVKAIT